MKCTPNEDELERYFYTVDELGSTTLITSNSANVANEYYYDAFGNVIESREDIHNRITYTGQLFDGATQQYYLRARFYNPAIGRFTQEDIYRGDGLNLYAYCRNNPVRYYDPSGYLCSGKINQYNEEVKNFQGSRLEYLRNKYNSEGVGKAGNSRFPSNPDDLLPEIERKKVVKSNGTTSQVIYTSDSLRIRAEQHPLLEGELYNPRHHGVHYHVEYRIDTSKSWNNKRNVGKYHPEGYTNGGGTGFIPGEKFPGK